MKCEEMNNIWLEDELPTSHRKALHQHIQVCEQCKQEYQLKSSFMMTVDDYKKRCEDNNNIKIELKKQNTRNKKRKMLIPLVATFTLTILLFASVTFAKKPMFNFVGFITENFGWNLSNAQEGSSYVKDDFKLDISSISVSKSNISFAFVINSTKVDNLVLRPRDLWIETNGKIYRPYGFAGASFEKEAGYGELNFNMTDGLKEDLVFKIKDIEIYKIERDKMSHNGKVIEGVWDIPIKLDSLIIEKANKNSLCYLIDQNIRNNDININLNTLEIEDTKTIISHQITAGEIRSLGDIQILDDKDKIVTERRYNNGNIEFVNEAGKNSSIMMYENFPFETVLLPLGNNKPAKILINSFIINNGIGLLDISKYISLIMSVNNNEIKFVEKEENISGIPFKVRAYRESGIIEIVFTTSKIIEPILSNSTNEVKPIESNCTKADNGANQYFVKYQLKSGNEKYTLEVFETKEIKTKISVSLIN